MVENGPVRGLPRRRKVIYGLVLTLLFYLFAELGLRARGRFTPETPFVEFEPKTGEGRVRFTLNQFQPDFARKKPRGVFRIMIAGDSTTVGFPYQPRSSFGLRLRELLAAALPEDRVEVIHLGKTGVSSREVEAIVSAGLTYQPDVMIVYSGQNEFITLPKRPSALTAQVQKVFSRSRVWQAASLYSRLVLGGAALMVLSRGQEKKGPDLELPAPPPLSADQYQRALREYRENLKKIVRDCRRAQVPLILCTMAVNLADWAPEFLAYPAGWTTDKQNAAQRLFQQAQSLLDQRRLAEVSALIVAKPGEFKGYAPLAFLLGRARLGLISALPSPDPALPAEANFSSEREALRGLLLSDFRRALSEENQNMMSSRAPPEINAIIRETASAPGVWLLDAEREFLGASDLPPGFDWFEDHCHPNPAGQQLVAVALYNLLRRHDLPVTAADWKPADWNERSFDDQYRLDDEFLYHVYLKMALWLGVGRRLPRHDAYLRDRLNQCSRLKPEEPLPVILETIYDLAYGDSTSGGTRLARWYQQNPQALEAAVAKNFTRAVDLRQGIFMVRLTSDPRMPVLRGLMNADLFSPAPDISARSSAGPDLNYYSAFLDLTSPRPPSPPGSGPGNPGD